MKSLLEFSHCFWFWWGGGGKVARIILNGDRDNNNDKVSIKPCEPANSAETMN